MLVCRHMKKLTTALVTISLAAAVIAAEEPPRVFILDGQTLLENRRRVRAGDGALKAAMARLIREADAMLSAGPFSVTQKTLSPPSGDKHDYRSVGPYWWPDPEKPDGLPYTRKDGQVNPERGYSIPLRTLVGICGLRLTMGC